MKDFHDFWLKIRADKFCNIDMWICSILINDQEYNVYKNANHKLAIEGGLETILMGFKYNHPEKLKIIKNINKTLTKTIKLIEAQGETK